VVALGAYEATKPIKGHRLNDFTRWTVAAEPGAGLPPGSIAKALLANRTESAEEVLQDPLAQAIRTIAVKGFSGTTTQFANVLLAHHDVPGIDTSHRVATALGIKLNDMSTEMSKVGVMVRKRGRKWDISEFTAV